MTQSVKFLFISMIGSQGQIFGTENIQRLVYMHAHKTILSKFCVNAMGSLKTS